MFLYRLFNAADEALYVGITRYPEQRFKTHRSQSWWSEVARRDLEEIPDDEAFSIERDVIRQLAPAHNKQSNPNHPGTIARTRSAAWHGGRAHGATSLTEAAAKTRYGVSAHTDRTRLAHQPVQVYLAWRDGDVVSAGARWRCGGITSTARLSNTANGLEECRRCAEAAS